MSEVIEKGYSINLNRIDEGFMYSEETVTAPNRSEAKSKLLRKVRYDDMKLKHGETLTYLNIPVVRNKDFDIVDFEGKPTPRHEIDRILRTRKRNEYFQSIIDNPNVTHCYIRKGGSYYRPNSCGYTEFVTRAGVYEKEEAVKHGVSCSDLGIEPINTEEHNQRLQKEIDEMKSRLISPDLLK